MSFPESSFARTGRFSEIYPVGRGAAGQVYAARDNLGRRVAVKEALPAAEGDSVRQVAQLEHDTSATLVSVA